MHDRISVNNLCFGGTHLAADIEFWRSLKANQIGVQSMKIRTESGTSPLTCFAVPDLRSRPSFIPSCWEMVSIGTTLSRPPGKDCRGHSLRRRHSVPRRST